MTVEIRGTTTTNKGAQLMLEAIVERLGEKCRLSAPTAVLEYSVRAKLGIFQTLHVNRIPRLSASAGGAVPREVRRRYGLVADSEISGVLDASGFAYSDSFKPAVSKREALYGRRWRERGIPKIMLPQAFGPFRDEELTKWACEVLGQSSIVFARDRISMQHLKALRLPIQVEQSPDFTIGLAPVAVSVPVHGDYTAIVPNNKLVSRGIVSEETYIDFLVKMGSSAQGQGLTPLIVIHEDSDRRLAMLLAARLNAAIFSDSRPRALKGAIGGSTLLIGSRFHAIVGGLSQSVRTIAIGWSHKYGELLEDFGVPDWAIGLDADPQSTVRNVLGNEHAIARLRDAKESLAGQVEKMWETTEEILGLNA